MDEYEAFKLYRNLRLHFTDSKFDIRTTHARNVTRKSLEKQKFRPILQKLISVYSEKQFIEYMVSNFAHLASASSKTLCFTPKQTLSSFIKRQFSNSLEHLPENT